MCACVLSTNTSTGRSCRSLKDPRQIKQEQGRKCTHKPNIEVRWLLK